MTEVFNPWAWFVPRNTSRDLAKAGDHIRRNNGLVCRLLERVIASRPSESWFRTVCRTSVYTHWRFKSGKDRCYYPKPTKEAVTCLECLAR